MNKTDRWPKERRPLESETVTKCNRLKLVAEEAK